MDALYGVGGEEDWHSMVGGTQLMSPGGWVADASGVALLAVDRPGVVRYANRAAEVLLSEPAGGLVGRMVTGLIGGVDGRNLYDMAEDHGWPADDPLRAVPGFVVTGSGETVPVEVRLSLVSRPLPVVVAAVIDRRPPARPGPSGSWLAAAGRVSAVLAESDPGDLGRASQRVLGVLASALASPAGAVWVVGEEGLNLIAAYPPTGADGSRPDDLVRVVLEDGGLRRRPAAPGWDRLVAPLVAGGSARGVIDLVLPAGTSGGAPVLDVVGVVTTVLGAFVAHAQAEASTRSRLELLAGQVDASPDGILVVSSSGTVLSVNATLSDMAGADAADLVGGDVLTVRKRLAETAADPAGVFSTVDTIREDGAATGFELGLADGRRLDCRTSPLRRQADGSEYARVWHFRDVTTTRAAEEGLAALARTLQASLLPPHLPRIPGVDVGAAFRAGADGLDVGGDFYDVFAARASRWAVVVGDVCGKGAEAAAVTAMARYAARAAAMNASRPDEIAAAVNHLLLAQDADQRFVTSLIGLVSPRAAGAQITLCAAGHPLPFLLLSDGTVREVGLPGPLLGVIERPVYSPFLVRLGPGDTLVCFTDGLTEARDRNGLLGEEGLLPIVASLAAATPQEMADALVVEAARLGGGRPHDDVAVVVLRAAAETGQ